MDGSTHSGLLAMHAQSNMSDLRVKLTVYMITPYIEFASNVLRMRGVGL